MQFYVNSDFKLKYGEDNERIGEKVQKRNWILLSYLSNEFKISSIENQEYESFIRSDWEYYWRR